MIFHLFIVKFISTHLSGTLTGNDKFSWKLFRLVHFGTKKILAVFIRIMY